MSNTVLVTSVIRTAAQYFIEHIDSVRLTGFPISTHRLLPPKYVGSSKIIGTVRVTGVLAQRRVSLLERQTLFHIKSVQSDEITGAFEFTELSAEKNYIVIADDGEQGYNAAIADWVQVND